MKTTKIKWMLFLLPIILLYGGVEFFYREVPNNYTQKANSIKKHSNETEVLLFGDSHCFYGLNPSYFSKKTFNLSNVSQTLYFDHLLFEKYVDQLPKLKQVVFCIEYTNLSQEDNTQDDVWRKYYYQQYMNLEVPSISIFDIKQYSLALTQNLDRTVKLLIRYFKTGSIIDCDTNGWGTNYKKKDRIRPEEVAKHRAIVQEDGSVNFDVNSNRMQKMITECEQRNIQVIIVSMPQTKLFESYLNPKKLKKIIATCTGFQRNNKNTVHYINLFHDNRFIDEDFFDADHLNDIGATKCSKIVNDSLNKFKLSSVYSLRKGEKEMLPLSNTRN
jgi:hypothetical protein